MLCAWLADSHDPPGGAELTQAEFRAAAPEGVRVIDCPPDHLERLNDCEVACVFNAVTYPRETIDHLGGKRVVRYWNDLAPFGDQALTRWLCEHSLNIFCSPLHRDRFPHDHNGSELIPPPVDLDRFRAAARANGERKGAVSVGSWGNPGKAPWRAAEVAPDVDFYGGGPVAPEGSEPVAYEDLPALLARYATFVYLPDAVEPFGRVVAEAWAAGLRVITNRLLGARYWIEEAPDKMETAASDFWALVLET